MTEQWSDCDCDWLENGCPTCEGCGNTIWLYHTSGVHWAGKHWHERCLLTYVLEKLIIEQLKRAELGKTAPRQGEHAMSDELKPCPFCSSNMLDTDSWPVPEGTTGYQHTEYCICCNNCGTQGPNDFSKSRAREMWNLRRVANADREWDLT